MMALNVHAGYCFNRLTFVSRLSVAIVSGKEKRRFGKWRCACGNFARIPIGRVVGGYIKSCGCLKREVQLTVGLKHGYKGTPTYSSWSAMKSRCLNTISKDFPRYGEKGVTMCSAWLKFDNFLSDMGERPPKTTLDRYPNNNGNYEPGNCRWASHIEQARNKDNFTLVKTPSGIFPLIDYAKTIGISNGAAHLRLKRGKLEGCERYA